MKVAPTPTLSLVELIEQRERKVHLFDVPNFLGGVSSIKGKIAIRVVTVAEQETAIIAAHRYAKDRTKDSPAASDNDLLENVKTAYVLHAACRDAKTPMEPAFPSGKWMLEHLSAGELSVLLNHYNEVLRITGPHETAIEDPRVEAVALACAQHSDSEAPNMAFTRLSREQVAEYAIRFAVKLFEARTELALLKAAPAL